MRIEEYFDAGNAVGDLVGAHYTICECKMCGSLVVMNKKSKHAQWHERQSALMQRLEAMASTSRQA